MRTLRLILLLIFVLQVNVSLAGEAIVSVAALVAALRDGAEG